MNTEREKALARPVPAPPATLPRGCRRTTYYELARSALTELAEVREQVAIAKLALRECAGVRGRSGQIAKNALRAMGERW